jgi:CRP-like cAMP-binding protein
LLFDLPAGRTLTKEGARGREFFALAERQADVTKNGRKVATLSDGDFFGEIALLTKMPRNATVTQLRLQRSVLNASPASRSTRPSRFSRSGRGRRLARR